MSDLVYDYAVVGGGIAGLAIAEVFARSGRSVILIEREERLCQGTSASQHGWFHFGSLYSIFPQNQFLRTMVGGVEDLLTYYKAFPGMNIAIGDDGHLVFPQSKASWFRDEPIEYIVCARNDPDFDMSEFSGFHNYAKKLLFLLTWEVAIKQFVSRHQRFHKHDWRGGVAASQWIPRAGWADYSRHVISKPHHPGINLDVDTHFRIVGYDRPMHATTIVTDLLCSLIGSGGETAVGAEVIEIEKAGAIKTVCTANGASFKARTIIAATGQWLERFLGASGTVRILASPLLVVYPALSNHNFVRMTPFVEKSVNHLHHRVDGHTYSLVGGGYFADPGDVAAMARAEGKLRQMAKDVFPGYGSAEVRKIYHGYKTEIVARAGERNYQYLVRAIDDGIFAVVPGKFSLAFSLAINVFKRLTGESPSTKITKIEPDTIVPLVGATRHAGIIREYFDSGLEAKSSEC